MCGKLVRDFIPDFIRADGLEPDVEVLEGTAYEQALDAKLLEEAIEVQAALTTEQKLEELADLEEVALARLESLGFTPEDRERVRLEKAAKRGGFAARLFLKVSKE